MKVGNSSWHQYKFYGYPSKLQVQTLCTDWLRNREYLPQKIVVDFFQRFNIRISKGVPDFCSVRANGLKRLSSCQNTILWHIKIQRNISPLSRSIYLFSWFLSILGHNWVLIGVIIELQPISAESSSVVSSQGTDQKLFKSFHYICWLVKPLTTVLLRWITLSTKHCIDKTPWRKDLPMVRWKQ